MTGGGFGGSSVAVVPDERVEAVMRAIDAAFVLEGFRSPAHLRADAVGRRGRARAAESAYSAGPGTPPGVARAVPRRQFSA